MWSNETKSNHDGALGSEQEYDKHEQRFADTRRLDEDDDTQAQDRWSYGSGPGTLAGDDDL